MLDPAFRREGDGLAVRRPPADVDALLLRHRGDEGAVAGADGALQQHDVSAMPEAVEVAGQLLAALAVGQGMWLLVLLLAAGVLVLAAPVLLLVRPEELPVLEVPFAVEGLRGDGGRAANAVPLAAPLPLGDGPPLHGVDHAVVVRGRGHRRTGRCTAAFARLAAAPHLLGHGPALREVPQAGVAVVRLLRRRQGRGGLRAVHAVVQAAVRLLAGRPDVVVLAVVGEVRRAAPFVLVVAAPGLLRMGPAPLRIVLASLAVEV